MGFGAFYPLVLQFVASNQTKWCHQNINNKNDFKILTKAPYTKMSIKILISNNIKRYLWIILCSFWPKRWFLRKITWRKVHFIGMWTSKNSQIVLTNTLINKQIRILVANPCRKTILMLWLRLVIEIQGLKMLNFLRDLVFV